MVADRTDFADSGSARPESPAAPPRRRALFAAAAMALGAAVSLAALEVGLRVVGPAWLEQRMREVNAGELGWEGSDRDWPIVLEDGAFRHFVPGSDFTVSHSEYRHAVTIDELGGRATPYSPGYTEIVPFLGDSFTFGVGVEDHETFVSLIAAEADSSRRLLNLGVTGTALHNQLDTLELRHEELGSPDFYVFALFMGNDLSNIRRHYQRSAFDASMPGGDPSRRWLFRANVVVLQHPVLKRLYAIQFLRQKALAVMNRSTGGFMGPVFLAMRTDLPYFEEGLGFLRRELERLTEISGRLGFEFAVILIPDVYQVDAGRRAGKVESLGLDPAALDPDRLATSISQALDDFSVPYHDLGPCLTEAGAGELYYVQDNHFTAEGHAAAAGCVEDSGLLDRLSGP